MKNRTRPVQHRPSLDPSKIHLRTVQDFIINHCQQFDWATRALGATRAKDLPTLLKLSNVLADDLHSMLDDLRHDDHAAAKFLIVSQFVALISKYDYPSGTLAGVDPEAAAIVDLLKTERRNARLNAIFASHLKRRTDRHWCLPIMRDVICHALGRTPDYRSIFENCDFSGGASVKRSGDATHLANKLGGEISGPLGAFELFVTALSTHHQYTGVFVERSIDGNLYYTYEELLRRVAERYEPVDYNIVTVVPKKANMGRTIGKEPEALNFLQKGIDTNIRQILLSKFGVDLSSQKRNQDLAYYGSLGKVDPYVTIDLRGASNGVITELVRTLVPPRWFKLLDQTRSKYGLIDNQLHRYQLFCSMGNGFCFPLETLIFVSAVIAAHKHCGQRLDYAVYGDDIIVRQSVALVTIECLLACGFRTNTSKTFVHGPFRESCGANWYGGQDVTPGYYKKRVTSRQELYAIHNSLNRWPEIQLGLRQWTTLVHAVPDTRQYDWVTNQAFRVSQDLCMTARATRWVKETRCWSYPLLVGLPVVDPLWESRWSLGDGIYTDVEHMRLTATLRGATPEEPFHLRFTTKCVTKDTVEA